MQLLTTSSALKSNLSRLLKRYDNVAFGVAWASAGTSVFEELKTRQENIRTGVIGTHFYQTHPDVLDTFVGYKHVRFMLQPQGVFHPKVYCFWNDENEWEVILGSANLTNAALTVNTEISTLFSNADGKPALLMQIRRFIDEQFDLARPMNMSDAESYRRIWKLRQPELRRLGGQYGNATTTKPPIDIPIMAIGWDQFLTQIKSDKTHGFRKRCDLLTKFHTEFMSTPHFKEMSHEVRCAIAGLRSDFDENSRWFGSMVGAGKFYKAINSNNIHISDALDYIPLNGLVTRRNYDAFIDEYLKAFPTGRDGIGTATRLLAMKRPDYFVCVDSKNRDKLTDEFEIKKAGLDYERYWDEIVARLVDTPWWTSDEPLDPLERQAWNGRAAMLDALFYEE